MIEIVKRSDGHTWEWNFISNTVMWLGPDGPQIIGAPQPRANPHTFKGEDLMSFQDDQTAQQSYHDARYGQEQWDAIRLAAKNFIIEIQRSCPACGDRDTAIKYANAAIALEGLV